MSETIGDLVVKITPDIDADEFESHIRVALARALRNIADSLDGEEED